MNRIIKMKAIKKKTALSLLLITLITNMASAQITDENGILTGMSIQNPSNSSNSYYTVNLTETHQTRELLEAYLLA